MNKYQRRILKNARWLAKTFDMTWRKAKKIATYAAKVNEKENTHGKVV